MYNFIKFFYRIFNNFSRKLNRRYSSWRGKLACGSYKTPPNLAFKCEFTKNTHLGKNTNFNGLFITGEGRVDIGDNFHSGRNCKIITSFHNYEGETIPYDRSFITKDVTIEDNVWLGDDVIILGGTTIGEGAIIQAGSVVAKSIPKYAIAGGHPALPFKYRNKEHYEKLKAKGKFL